GTDDQPHRRAGAAGDDLGGAAPQNCELVGAHPGAACLPAGVLVQESRYQRSRQTLERSSPSRHIRTETCAAARALSCRPTRTRRTPMPEITERNDVVTQITTVKVPSKNQSEVLELMEQRARFMATQPGFVSVSLHRSEDGNHVVNYVQWRNREQLAAAHHS